MPRFKLGRRKLGHPDSWIFGPKYSVKEVIEKRPPFARIGIVVAAVLMISAVSAVALTRNDEAPAAIVDAGVPAGTALTASSGLRVTEDGATIDALDVTGQIYVRANDVTITSTRVRTGAGHAIRLASGYTNLTVTDSTLECTTDTGRSGVAWNNYTAERVVVGEGCRRGFVHGANTTIVGSYWGDERYDDVRAAKAPSTTLERDSSSWVGSTTTATAAPVPTTAPPTTAAPPEAANPPSRPRPADGVEVPSACRNQNGTVNGTEPRSAFPTDASTGPEVDGYDETFMSPSGHDGGWTIDEDGAVIDGVFHNGVVTVAGDNVTIRNSIICGSGNHIVMSDGNGLTIENSVIRGQRGEVQDPSNGAPCQSAVAYGDFTIRTSEITGCIDGVKASGTTEIYDSFFHDAYANRFGDGAGTHNDTVQSVGSPMPRLIFEGNAAYQDPCTSNRHFQLAPLEQQPPTDLMRVDGNFFYGMKGFNLDRGFAVVDGIIQGNTFAGSATVGPFSDPMYSGDGLASIRRVGNVYEGSGSADGNMPTNYQCTPG